MSYHDEWLDSLFDESFDVLSESDPIVAAMNTDFGGFDPQTLDVELEQPAELDLPAAPDDMVDDVPPSIPQGVDTETVLPEIDSVAAASDDPGDAIQQTLESKREEMAPDAADEHTLAPMAQSSVGEIIRAQGQESDSQDKVQVVTLAPGTQLEIVGIGTAEVRGTAAVET